MNIEEVISCSRRIYSQPSEGEKTYFGNYPLYKKASRKGCNFENIHSLQSQNNNNEEVSTTIEKDAVEAVFGMIQK